MPAVSLITGARWAIYRPRRLLRYFGGNWLGFRARRRLYRGGGGGPNGCGRDGSGRDRSGRSRSGRSRAGGAGATAWVTGGAGFNALATWAKFQRRAKELRTISANGAGMRLIWASVAESPFLWVKAWKSVAPMPATSSAWPAAESLQAIAAQLYRLLRGNHAGRFHVAVRHALFVNGSERAHHGFGHFAALFRGEGLTLQHIRETLLDVLHDGVHKQGVVEVDLANFEDGDQIRDGSGSARPEAGDHIIRIR